jgi:hypothetical protein
MRAAVPSDHPAPHGERSERGARSDAQSPQQPGTDLPMVGLRVVTRLLRMQELLAMPPAAARPGAEERNHYCCSFLSGAGGRW